MDGFGDDLLLSIFNRIHNQGDRNSFSRVCKKFWKTSSCVRYQRRLHITFPEFLDYILTVAASPNLKTFECHKPLSNQHMSLLAQWCPNLSYLSISLNKCFDPHDQAANFDDDGLCAVTNACMHLSSVLLNRRLHVSDVGVASLFVRSNSLTRLDLSECVNVTDESLKAIGESSHLQSLSLAGCRWITDLGLEYLAKGKVRSCLWKLNLAECDRISDDGIVLLKEMCSLQDLNLSKCGINVTDRGVQTAMSQIPGMFLNLSWLKKVMDVSIFAIGANCRNLVDISLVGCEGVTGKGLLAFVNHTSLQTIDLFSCHHISTKDVESFIAARRRYIKTIIYIRMPESMTRKYFTGWD
uniref:F-box/LRR-repeat protein 2-like n=1 Tax=Erigeron canadensis TaxID=72917 RepID=UPI001CB94720|nr:F-box/LRR-repeat protein 2-like [Erigeron canadensis]